VSRPRWITWAFVAAGLAVGGAAGDRRFDAAYDPESLCPTCHDDADVLDRSDVPHTDDYASVCHACHVYGMEEYVAALFETAGLSAPRWTEGLQDPVLAQQTCLGCHSRVARPEIDCAVCHADGASEVIQVASCETCHVEQVPLAPHDGAPCAQCHLETVASPRGMARMLLEDSVRRREEGSERQRAGSSMRTKDMDADGPEVVR